MAKKTTVIGSGFGGLAAALRLKAKGHKVTLVEKHPDLGGRARVFKKDQFIYDGGPTVITAPYCLLYTSPSPRDLSTSRMPSSA